jgi:zinc transport system substrate-binding protein
MIRALLLALLLAARADAEPLHVFVSVLPLQTFVEKVGGEYVDAEVMVRPGQSPHTYDPTPQQVAALAQADLYVRVGMPFESAWMGRLRAANPDMRVLDAREGIDLRPLASHDHGDKDHGHSSALDPHVWTSPLLVERMAANIRDTLTDLDPAHEAGYARNYEAFAAELRELDRDIRTLLTDAEGRKFLVFHPSWGYFADTYGLIQIPIEKEGKEPGARALTALIEQAKREDIRVIFVQPQFSRRSAQQVARAIGGGVVAIDPLAPDYADNLRRAARQIAEALRP